jgi:hypothetical protein
MPIDTPPLKRQDAVTHEEIKDSKLKQNINDDKSRPPLKRQDAVTYEEIKDSKPKQNIKEIPPESLKDRLIKLVNKKNTNDNDNDNLNNRTKLN